MFRGAKETGTFAPGIHKPVGVRRMMAHDEDSDKRDISTYNAITSSHNLLMVVRWVMKSMVFCEYVMKRR